MPQPAKLLFIIGSDRDDRMVVVGGQLNISASTDLHLLLDNRIPVDRTLMTRNFFRQQRVLDPGYECILNLITEAEENSRVLDNLRKFVRISRQDRQPAGGGAAVDPRSRGAEAGRDSGPDRASRASPARLFRA